MTTESGNHLLTESGIQLYTEQGNQLHTEQSNQLYTEIGHSVCNCFFWAEAQRITGLRDIPWWFALALQ